MAVTLNEIEVAGVAIAALGSVGSVVMAVMQARKLSSMKRVLQVRFRDLQKIRDVVLKNEIQSLYPEFSDKERIKRLDDAFAQADTQFQEEFLPAMFGIETAFRLSKALQQQDIAV
jgi:hypothetical protein